MRRVGCSPRTNWESKVEAVGLTWHTPDQTYWNESAFYQFTAKEVDVLEAASNKNWNRCHWRQSNTLLTTDSTRN